jgi:transposase
MEGVRFVGLDVHADSIAIAVAEPGRGEPSDLATIPNDTVILLKRLRRLGRVKCCYEVGPTGFGLHRDLTAAGIDCMVVAPSLVPSRAGDRVKTDRRDAVKLASTRVTRRPITILDHRSREGRSPRSVHPCRTESTLSRSSSGLKGLRM